MNNASTMFLLIALLALFFFFREDIFNLFKKNNFYNDNETGTDFGFILEYQEYLKNLVGEKELDILLSFLAILIITWIIGALFTLLTRKDSSNRILKLGNSGTIIIILVLAVLFIALVDSITSKTEPKREVTVDARKIRTDHYIDVPIKVLSSVDVLINPTNPREEKERGKAFWVCPEVIKPENPNINETYFEVVAGKGTTKNTYQITEKSRMNLTSFGIDTVIVRFTKKLSNPDKNPCRFSP